MDPMALLQYQFLMARAAEYRAIATRQAMIANARMGGFTAVGDAATPHSPELDKVRFVPMFSAQECELSCAPRPPPATRRR